MKKQEKILIIFVIIVIIIGMFLGFTKGFNYSLEYSKSTEIKFGLQQNFNIYEINNITKDVFGDKKIKIQKIDYFNDSVAITVQNPTDEELSNLVEKINGKYGLNYSVDSLNKIQNGEYKINEIIKPYILPTAIALIFVVAYMAIMYRKNLIKAILTPVLGVALAELLFFSLIAIARVEISMFTMPLALALMVIVLTLITIKFEKK